MEHLTSTQGGLATPQGIWTLAKLTPEQERMLKEAEKTFGDSVLLAFSQQQVAPSKLDQSQLERLQGLEQKLGFILVAVEPARA